jgi:two-component system, NarL family, nitrate/nitrite response regulator NarL
MVPKAHDFVEVELSVARVEDCGGGKLPRVLIVSSVRLYREGLAVILAATGRVELVGVVAEADLPTYLSNLSPDVVLLDMELVNSSGCATVAGCSSGVKVIAFAVSDLEDDVLACAECGVSSFVGKDGSAEDILAAIEGLLHGELPCPPKVAGMLFQRLTELAQSRTHRSASAELSPREFEVLRLLDRGRSNKEIACQLGIGAATVKNHVHNILEKLHVHRRGEAGATLRSVSHLNPR